MNSVDRNAIAFDGNVCIAKGSLTDVAVAGKRRIDANHQAQILVFDRQTSETIEIDFRGSEDDVAKYVSARYGHSTTESKGEAEATKIATPGRPRLGVVAREVTLLPRHWDWLGEQPGGASVALRKLVEQASRENSEKDRARKSTESCYRFMSVMAGDLVGFEEASRALFAGKLDVLQVLASAWPQDIREHVMELAEAAKA